MICVQTEAQSRHTSTASLDSSGVLDTLWSRALVFPVYTMGAVTLPLSVAVRNKLRSVLF